MPQAVEPSGVAWRLLQKPHVKQYIDAVRELEVQQLGVTRAKIAANYQAVITATDPSSGQADKYTIHEGVSVPVGQPDPSLLREHREATKALSQHLGLDKPIRVEHSGSVKVQGFEGAREQLDALFKRALPAAVKEK